MRWAADRLSGSLASRRTCDLPNRPDHSCGSFYSLPFPSAPRLLRLGGFARSHDWQTATQRCAQQPACPLPSHRPAAGRSSSRPFPHPIFAGRSRRSGSGPASNHRRYTSARQQEAKGGQGSTTGRRHRHHIVYKHPWYVLNRFVCGLGLVGVSTAPHMFERMRGRGARNANDDGDESRAALRLGTRRDSHTHPSTHHTSATTHRLSKGSSSGSGSSVLRTRGSAAVRLRAY